MFDFKKNKILLGNGKVGTFPNPCGMSGGGAYEVFYSADNELSNYSLVGILTEWNPSQMQYMKCTKASLIKMMIDNQLTTAST